MNVKSIRTTSSENGKNLTIWYEDDDGELQMLVARIAGDVQSALGDFMADGDPNALLERVLSVSYDIDDMREHVRDGLDVRLRALSTHLSTDGDHVYYDTDTFENLMLDESLEDHIVSVMKGGDDADLHAVCRFAERVYGNVDPQIRAQLFSWLKSQGLLTFDDDGRIIGYRGGELNADGVAESIHCGPAIVNGQRVNGHVPNPDGAIVEMPRGNVTHDPGVACSSGLHVGTYRYATGWARDVIMRVAVAPEDVVSVPFDCDAQKLRCCRFEVLSHEPCDGGNSQAADDWQHSLTYHDDDDADGTQCGTDGYGCRVPVIDSNADGSDDADVRRHDASGFVVGGHADIDYVPFGCDAICHVSGTVMQVMPDSVVVKTLSPLHFVRVYYDTMRG